MRGALEAGHEVEKVRVQEKRLLVVLPAMPVVIQDSVQSKMIWQILCKR